MNLKHFVYRLEYGFVRFMSGFLALLPFSFALKLARLLGRFLYVVFRKPRRMALENLREAFQREKSEREVHRIAQGAFIHLAEFGIEWLRMPYMIQNPERYLIEVYHKDKIHKALQEKKKGAIVLIGHTGNWEIMALMGGLLVAKPVQVPLYAVARPLKNPYLYDYVMKLRGGMGLKTIDKSGGVRDTFDRLTKENAIVCILVDQRVSEGSVEINFFGRPALTTSLPVVAALRLGTPIFFNFLYPVRHSAPRCGMSNGVNRTSHYRYEMKVEGPITIERTGDFKRDIQTNTQHLMDRIEREIRKDPTRWLWMHNRWRVAHGAKD
ncbi:MAG: hypothetical protein HYS55_00290 [Candidatus Omnitrophica bacterium]|nr:hypothetical protein [Candidatus Omnitrophota bacterium]